MFNGLIYIDLPKTGRLVFCLRSVVRGLLGIVDNLVTVLTFGIIGTDFQWWYVDLCADYDDLPF